MAFHVYILASGRNGTLYIGSTDELYRRVSEHKAHTLGQFTAKYEVTRLVYPKPMKVAMRRSSASDK